MDPILDDAERLERALTAWRAGRDPSAAFDELPAPLRTAARAAMRLEIAGADRIAGARPSFVHALEDQLRADLRLGLGGPEAITQPVAAPRLMRRLGVVVLLALSAGFALRGLVPVQPVALVETRIPLVPDSAPAVGLPAVAPKLDASGYRLPWLPERSPLPPVLVAADGDAPVSGGGAAAAAAAAIRAVRLAPVRPAPARPAVSAPDAAVAPVQTAAPVPADPVVANPAPSDPPSAGPLAEDEPAEPRPAPTEEGGGQASGAPPAEAPPTRTPDAEPEP